MSAERQMILDTAEKIFVGNGNGNGSGNNTVPAEAIWEKIVAAGLAGLLLPENAGGFGGDWGDAFSVIKLAGAQVLGLPLAETIIGCAVYGEDALTVFGGRVAIAESTIGKLEAGRFTGTLHGAAGGRLARLVLAETGGLTFALETSGAIITKGQTIAGDMRDALHFDGAQIRRCRLPSSLFSLGALCRVALIAGALNGALALSISYANDRQQFGKPIGKFQAVQQNLAIMAEAAAAVSCAADAAFAAAAVAFSPAPAGIPFNPEFEIGAAKLRANMAVDTATAIAHQVHGGIGFTQDYALHKLTRRLYAWRAEFGNERFWAERLGGFACDAGADGLWRYLAARADRIASTE